MTERHILHIHFHLTGGTDPEVYGRLIEQLQGISPRALKRFHRTRHCDVTGYVQEFYLSHSIRTAPNWSLRRW
ncbi:hypothetical protein OG741_01155 [Streptomyces sp. NBC_01410]|uniref:hypothetical protein n=1 Tax=Streptomyces sp. NBC_01410 TaxID=2903856 RepID=UPI0032478BB7